MYPNSAQINREYSNGKLINIVEAFYRRIENEKPLKDEKIGEEYIRAKASIHLLIENTHSTGDEKIKIQVIKILQFLGHSMDVILSRKSSLHTEKCLAILENLKEIMTPNCSMNN